MREDVVETLKDWLEQCRKSKEDGTEQVCEYEMLAVARFVKEASSRADDMETLGIAAQIEMTVQAEYTEPGYSEQYDEELRQQEERWEQNRRRNEHIETIRMMCVERFFRDGTYHIPMSAYASEIEENKDVLYPVGRYQRLVNYADEGKAMEKAFMSVFRALREKFCYEDETAARLPDEEDFEAAFEIAKADVYRKADKHIPSQIAKAKAEVAAYAEEAQ